MPMRNNFDKTLWEETRLPCPDWGSFDPTVISLLVSDNNVADFQFQLKVRIWRIICNDSILWLLFCMSNWRRRNRRQRTIGNREVEVMGRRSCRTWTTSRMYRGTRVMMRRWMRRWRIHEITMMRRFMMLVISRWTRPVKGRVVVTVVVYASSSFWLSCFRSYRQTRWSGRRRLRRSNLCPSFHNRSKGWWLFTRR